MGKRIIIVRHAKSSWQYDVRDHERPLSDRGIKDAHKISHECRKILNPDLIISSDATRARTTASIFISNLLIEKKVVHLNPNLYDFSGEKLIEVIKAFQNELNEILIFGHNHAITFFVNKFGDKYFDNVPTCGLVIIEFDINQWNDLKKGKTIKTMFPRDFKN